MMIFMSGQDGVPINQKDRFMQLRHGCGCVVVSMHAFAIQFWSSLAAFVHCA